MPCPIYIQHVEPFGLVSFLKHYKYVRCLTRIMCPRVCQLLRLVMVLKCGLIIEYWFFSLMWVGGHPIRHFHV